MSRLTESDPSQWYSQLIALGKSGDRIKPERVIEITNFGMLLNSQGTRVTLRTILASLAEGISPKALLADFPTLTEDDVRAVIAFAATSAEEDLPLAEIPRAS